VNLSPVLDFALPIMWLAQVAKGGERKRIFLKPAVAHTVHILATILPLVFSIFLSGHVSWFVNFYLEIGESLPSVFFFKLLLPPTC